jgi:hypothetical protein
MPATPFIKLRGALGGLRLAASYYTELWRNLGLIQQGVKRSQKYHPEARAIVGGGAVSVFYEQLENKLPAEPLFPWVKGKRSWKKFYGVKRVQDERCYVVGETKPRDRLIHEQPAPARKNRL